MCAINRMAEQELLNPSGESKLFDTEEPRAAKDSMGPGEPTFVGRAIIAVLRAHQQHVRQSVDRPPPKKSLPEIRPIAHEFIFRNPAVQIQKHPSRSHRGGGRLRAIARLLGFARRSRKWH